MREISSVEVDTMVCIVDDAYVGTAASESRGYGITLTPER